MEAETDTRAVLYIRMPPDLHYRLFAAACDHRMSMNQFCVEKLNQLLDEMECPKLAEQAEQASVDIV